MIFPIKDIKIWALVKDVRVTHGNGQFSKFARNLRLRDVNKREKGKRRNEIPDRAFLTALYKATKFESQPRLCGRLLEIT